MAKKSPWLQLVKRLYREILSEGKLKGVEALKEAMKRAKKIWVQQKKKS